jgi:hypothetical protein
MVIFSFPFVASTILVVTLLVISMRFYARGKLLEIIWKQAKKWKNQDSWNGTIVLTNKKFTKVVCFKCYNHKTMTCNN